MTFFSAIGRVFRTTGKGIFGVLSRFKISLFLFVFFIIFIQAAIVGIQEGSFTPFFTKIAGEFILATDNLNAHSLAIIEEGGIWNVELGFFARLWDFIKNIWNYIESIVIIYFWIKILMLLFLYGVIMDTSKAPTAWIFAIIVFLMVQPLAMVSFGERFGGSGDPWIVFTSFKNFFISIPYIFKPISSVAERFARDVSTNTSLLNNT